MQLKKSTLDLKSRSLAIKWHWENDLALNITASGSLFLIWHTLLLYVLGMGSYNSTFFTLCICPRKNWQSSIQALTRCAVDGRQKLARLSFWTWPSLHVYRTSSFFKTICPLCLNRTVGVTPANIPIFKHFFKCHVMCFLNCAAPKTFEVESCGSSYT